MHVVYLEPLPPEVETLVRECLPEGFTLQVRRPGEDPVSIVDGADFLLVATAPVTDEVLARAPRLRLIQHQGVGYDNVDVAAAARRGVPVALTPEGTTIPVAEHVFLLILSLYRNLLTAAMALRDGRWLQWSLRPHSFNLMGKRLGIVGLGRIGREVARRGRAFGCEVLYTDLVRAPAEVEAELGATYVSLGDLLAQVEILTLHVPLTEATRGLIGARELARMRPSAILINTARGGLVDEEALYHALVTGQIAGAGLDVFAQEPPPPDHPLLRLENVVATPHIAAGTRDALQEKMRAAFANMQRVAQGLEPLHRVA
ncbi:MAG: 2-hydroxyacid dehydrogenase [Anaerolineae bacterium]